MPDDVIPAAPVANAPPPSATPAVAPATAPVVAPPAAPTGSGATLAGGAATAPSSTAPVAGTAYSENWRDLMAGEDKAYREQLNRFSDPAALGKAYKELQGKLSSGAYRAPAPPEGATPEAVAAWRKDAGLPGEVKDYVAATKLDNGVIPGEIDKPHIENFAAMAHAKNWTPQQYNDALNWHYSNQDAALKQRNAEDQQFHQQAVDQLNKEWGPEFRGKVNAVNALFQGDKVLADRFLTGRTADGKLIGNDPQVQNFFARLAVELNPMATVLPSSGVNAQAVGEARIKEIESFMRKDISKYHADAPMKEEYGKLLAAKERMGPGR